MSEHTDEFAAVRTGASGVVPAEAGLPLTAEEVDALTEGTPVTVIWSGGNGPHNYVIAVDEWDEQRYAWDGKTTALRFYSALTFVGQQRFHTRVWTPLSDRFTPGATP